jgi:hypothetical protein
MRILPILSAACAIAICAVTSVNAQQPATTPRSAAAPAKLPPGMSFAWDASHTQITSGGVQLKASTLKSNSVSPTTGYVNIQINIKVRSRLEASTAYHCSAYVLGGIIDLDNGTVDGGLETANALASGSSGTYTCKFNIPYSWTLASDPGSDSGLIIAFGAAALNTKGEVQHSTLQVDGIENLPENGASSLFVYNVAL